MTALPATTHMPQHDPDSPGFGIYVHWPFCESKCPYCDFNSHVRDTIDDARWARALATELDTMAALAPERTVDSIFFGGGTPSLMTVATVEAVLERIAQHWPLAVDIEVTLEANPGSVEADRFAGYAAAGINRLSIGIQALDDDALRLLGRQHTVAEALRALDIANASVGRTSFDLIYARPGQTPDQWQAELARALDFGTEHLSLYQLSLEQGTRFWTLARRGELVVPDDDHAADLYELTQTMTASADLPAYEVSNHARPGAESRHNLIYWLSGDWVGVGPGAHGRLSDSGVTVARRQEKAPETWLSAVETRGDGTAEVLEVERHERIEEVLMMGLRLTDGLSDAAMRRAAGVGLDDAVAPTRRARLVASGHLAALDDTLRLTPQGRPLLNSVLRELLV
ncbi:MAG: radical SAM family heme chaperone HemW [Pseudomonadota bacterium]